MGYYEKAEPPVRDTRVKVGQSYCGNGPELMGCAGDGCLFKKDRSFWQANSCQMSLSLMLAASIENAAIIMHAPIGCGAQLIQQTSSTGAAKNKRGLTPVPFGWVTSNMQKLDIINGGAKSLREAIRYTDRELRPEIIFVVATCAPQIIGDDVDEIIESEAKNIAADITAIHCPGFKTRVVASAYDSFYHSLIRHIRFEPEPFVDFNPNDFADPFDRRPHLSYEFQKKNTVNLFNANSFSPDDEAEITRLLNAIGLNVRIYAQYSNRDKFRMVSEGALNVSMCNVHDDYILKYLEEKYGIPYVIMGMPLGREGIREWLIAIAEFFGRKEEAERVCDYEEKRLDEALQPILPKLKDKRVMIGGGVVRVAQEARMFKDLGMEVVSLRPHHYEPQAGPVYEELSESLPEVPVAVSNQLFELINQVKRNDPDLVVEHPGKPGWLAKAGYPSICLFSQARPFFGYAGMFAFARNIAFHLQNDNYEKRLREHIRLPYRESWYEKEPYSYIKD